MATILNTTATVSSPDVKYVVNATTSERTINGIKVTISVTANLTGSDSSLGTGSTYGIVGYIKLLGTEYSITIKGTTEKWSGTTTHTVSRTITLDGLNATDTSITGIKFRTTRTGDKDDGSIAHAGELGSTSCSDITFESAHTPPTDVTYEMTETNQKLIDLGIADNVFVKDLSIKSFNITGTLYDDATIKEYAIFNRLNVFASTTLPIVVDLSQNELLTDLTYVKKIPITAQLVDSFDTAGYSTTDLYDYIDYNKITLIETSTAAKRNGQTSGKVKLNIKGTYFNSDLGNAIQSGEYKPIIKYKYWKLGDTEPATYDYEISSDNIVISDGTYSVSGYEIGSSIETDTNHFNPDYAYRVKVYVEDNFTKTESKEKPIPVGEATWTEYKDRVDFKKITVQGKEIGGASVDSIYPVGSIYMSVNSTNPSELFGGTWEQIKDTFLLSAGDTYEAGSEGGESEHKLTVNEMPSHTHPVTGGASTGGSITAPQSYGSYFKTTRSMAGIATATGGGQAHNNMPPYLAVYMWKRIA